MTEGDRSRSPAAKRARPRRRRAGQRGFTLVELMIALLVSSLLVGMIFAIFIRMSIAYRGQQQVAEVQSKLAAARARIELDAKHAGLGLANGFHVAGFGPQAQPPLRVINNANAPDEVAFYFADTSVQAVVRDVPGGTICDKLQCNKLDSTAGFAERDVVVMSTAVPVANPADAADAKVVRFDACVFQLASVTPTHFTFSTDAPWGTPVDNSHCPYTPAPGTVFYKLAVRHWRIDPARPADGVLQLSKLGALAGPADWQDQAYGFIDLQVATRFFEPEDDFGDTPDPDFDTKRDWYSGEEQEIRTRPFTPVPLSQLKLPIQISISLVARTERDVEGIATASTPRLTVPGNENNNTIGDRPAVPLPSILPALAGHRIVRYTTSQVDLRNLGVGR